MPIDPLVRVKTDLATLLERLVVTQFVPYAKRDLLSSKRGQGDSGNEKQKGEEGEGEYSFVFWLVSEAKVPFFVCVERWWTAAAVFSSFTSARTCADAASVKARIQVLSLMASDSLT